jgi:hypothetical protein
MSDITDVLSNPTLDAEIAGALITVVEAILDRHKSGATSAADAIKEIVATLTTIDEADKAADAAGKAELDRRFPSGEVTPIPSGDG